MYFSNSRARSWVMWSEVKGGGVDLRAERLLPAAFCHVFLHSKLLIRFWGVQHFFLLGRTCYQVWNNQHLLLFSSDWYSSWFSWGWHFFLTREKENWNKTECFSLPSYICICISTPSTRKGKARRLMDENSVSFQMFLILVFYYTWFRKPNFCVQTMSEQYLEVGVFFVRGSMRRSQNLEIFSVKRNFIRHFARFNFSRLSLAFILKYYPILHAVKR